MSDSSLFKNCTKKKEKKSISANVMSYLLKFLGGKPRKDQEEVRNTPQYEEPRHYTSSIPSYEAPKPLSPAGSHGYPWTIQVDCMEGLMQVSSKPAPDVSAQIKWDVGVEIDELMMYSFSTVLTLDQFLTDADRRGSREATLGDKRDPGQCPGFLKNEPLNSPVTAAPVVATPEHPLIELSPAVTTVTTAPVVAALEHPLIELSPAETVPETAATQTLAEG